MKGKNVAFATAGVLLGRILYRVVSSHFGEKGSQALMFIRVFGKSARTILRGTREVIP